MDDVEQRVLAAVQSHAPGGVRFEDLVAELLVSPESLITAITKLADEGRIEVSEKLEDEVQLELV